MATTTTVLVSDDLDGSDGAETISFSFDGAAYIIDLSPKNQEKFRKTMQRYMDAGRRVKANGRRPSSGRTLASRTQSAKVRAWARSQGFAVSNVGRIRPEITDQYEAAVRAAAARGEHI